MDELFYKLLFVALLLFVTWVAREFLRRGELIKQQRALLASHEAEIAYLDRSKNKLLLDHQGLLERHKMLERTLPNWRED